MNKTPDTPVGALLGAHRKGLPDETNIYQEYGEERRRGDQLFGTAADLLRALEGLVAAVQHEQAALDTYEATRGSEDWPNAGDELEQAGIATARCLTAARAVIAKAKAAGGTG